MPKNYAMGGRVSSAPPAGGPPLPQAQRWRERLGALRNLPPFLKLVWQTSPALTLGSGALRFVRALLPVVTLYVGKLIIDEVVPLRRRAVGQRHAARARARHAVPSGRGKGSLPLAA